jgi:hypothetical protein
MWQAVHAENNHNVDAIIRIKKVTKFAFLNDFFWDVNEAHANVFGAFEGGVKVKVGKIHCHEVSTSSEDDTIEQDLGSKHVGSWGCNGTGIVNAITAHD